MPTSDDFDRDVVRFRPTRGKRFRPSKPIRTRRHLGGRNFVPGPRRARCFAHLSYLKVGKGGSSKLTQHIKYLSRDSAKSHNQDAPKSFGNAAPESFNQLLPGEKRVFKLVVSPEDFFTIEPKAFANVFMSRVQAAAGFGRHGQSFDWVGFLHTNTTQPHFHFVFRGLDSRGDDVYLSPRLIRDLRTIAQSVQETIGRLPTVSHIDQKEVRAAERLAPLPTRQRWNLDRYIAGLPSGTTYEQALSLVPIRRRSAFHARITYLGKLGLVTSNEGGVLAVANDLAGRLREMQALATAAVAENRIRYCNPADIRVDSGGSGSEYGLLTGIYHDRKHRQDWAVLETLNTTPLLVKVLGSTVENAIFWAVQKVVLHYHKGKLAPMKGNPVGRVKKLRARGAVVDAILGVVRDSPSTINSNLAEREHQRDEMGF